MDQLIKDLQRSCRQADELYKSSLIKLQAMSHADYQERCSPGSKEQIAMENQVFLVRAAKNLKYNLIAKAVDLRTLIQKIEELQTDLHELIESTYEEVCENCDGKGTYEVGALTLSGMQYTTHICSRCESFVDSCEE